MDLFSIDLKYESCLTLVKVNRKGNSSSERVEEQSSWNDPVPLTPARGRKFYNIKSADDETLYFLQSDSAIEVYDLNYVLSRVIEIPGPDVCFKILSNDPYKIVITLYQNELKAYRFQNAMDYIDKTVDRIKEEAVPGNPIIDMAFHAFFKFGCTNPEGGANSLFYLYTEVPNPECGYYVRSIPLLFQALDCRGTLPLSLKNNLLDSLPADEISVSVENLKWRLLSRAPVHICSIQGGNLIPLQNGLNNFEEFFGKRREDFISDFESYVKFGALESIIEETQGLKVVAIIGRQSSGKSYLLNRLFGTRFDVAAHRCTDGIWMSFARIENQVFLVMDCEGLFSVERSEQEEIKLCLLLAAIADVTILNQDLTFNRHLSSLLEKFRFGMDRLKGSSLFKGRLEIAIRDVPANQDQGTDVEVEKFVENLIETKKADFLLNLFSGALMCSSYHNFESGDMFETLVNIRRNCYMENIPVRWASGRDFLRDIKSVMAHIFTDDSTSIDFRSFQLKLTSISSDFKRAIEIPPAFEKLISPAKPEVSVSLKLFGASFKLSLFDVKVDLTQNYKVFEEFMRRYVDDEKRIYNHNHWYQSLDEFMAAYFEVYWTELLTRFEAKVVNSNADFRPIFLGEVSNLETIFNKLVRSRHNLCLKKCQHCDLECVKCQNHKDQCDCSTSHKCSFNCSICPKVKCSQNAGHSREIHFCISKPHTCGELCNMQRCEKPCTARPYHDGDHRCSAATHPCGEKCSIDICQRTCAIDQLECCGYHDCKQPICPFQCSICPKGNTRGCSEPHLHSLTEDTPQHFCDKEHPCKAECERMGTCSLLIGEPELRHLESGGSSYNFYYMSQEAKRLPCKNHFLAKATQHNGAHSCGNDHKCTEKCPDCKAYCEQKIGHSGLHYSAAHRNKENCIYLAKGRKFKVEAEEKNSTTTRQLQAGDSAQPEFCDQCCKRKGRGHTHPMECQGGSMCLQRVCPGKAVHSQAQYYPHQDKQYDLMECAAYWELKGWEPPVLRKDPQKQQEFTLCPCFCADPDHSEKVFCEGRLFHTGSMAYKDHQFSQCAHRSSSEFDIVFILDCTGSMGSAFPQVKSVITEITSQYKGSQLSCKFAIVGYTDHPPANGKFPGDYPVDVYPKNRQLESFDFNESQVYLTALKASGGGGNGGEAMLDGMNMCNSLRWRTSASRLVFIIGDEGPHGREFSSVSQYPNGCPCGYKWRNQLSLMKEEKTEIRFVQLSSSMNAAAILFRQEYGPRFRVMELEDMNLISQEVVKSIVKVIEHSLEFALT